MSSSFRSLTSLSLRGLPLAALFATLATPQAAASDVVVPSGFNAETRLAPGGMIAVLEDGTRVLSTGVFSDDKLSLQHADESVTLYATGIGSIAGLAQTPSTGDLVVGDSYFAALSELLTVADLNDDGDALDAGEVAPFPVPLPVLQGTQPPVPFSLIYRPGAPTDELYVSASTPGVVLRVADGAATVFADGFTYPAGMVWVDDTLYVANSVFDPRLFVSLGTIWACTDGNGDDDALDPGEMVAYATNLAGAGSLVRDSLGYFYVSGVTSLTDFTGAVARVAPDSDHDGVSDAIDHDFITGLGSFSSTLVLFEGPGGFAPGSAADGELWCGQFNGPPFFEPMAGNVIVRAAPHAALSLTGAVANNQSFTMHVAGEPGSQTLAVFALDQVGITLRDIGDLGFGFGGPYFIVPLPPIGGGGQSSSTMILHHVGGAVGLPFTLQAFTVRSGEIGISNALDLVVLP